MTPKLPENDSHTSSTPFGKLTIDVDGLGKLTGRTDGEVSQFLGVPYGVIDQRFTASRLAQNIGTCDCTIQGPLCPQQSPYDDEWNGVPKGKTRPFDIWYDEFHCLNLMLTRPHNIKHPLPVVIWLHGGNNNAGTAYRGSNDPSDWIRTGIKEEMPFIVVTPHFRLNVLGFLPIDGVGNWGLMDQRLCTEWVQRYIWSFGGDPDRVTLIGQSAGATCAFAQSLVEQPQFGQIALLSGSVRGLPPRTLDEYATLTRRICMKLELNDEQELRNVPWQSLIRATAELGINVYGAVDDGVFIPQGSWHEHALPKVHRVILSDCKEDGFYLKDDPTAAAIVRSNVPVDVVGGQLDTPDEVGQFFTNYIFAQGPQAMHEELLASPHHTVLRQLIDAPNPVDPSFGCNHMVELHYINHAYPTQPEFTSLINSVQAHWSRIVSFCNWDITKVLYVHRTGMELRDIADISTIRDLSGITRLRSGDFPEVRRFLCGW